MNVDIESDILIFADDTSLFATGSDPAETAIQLNQISCKNFFLGQSVESLI